MTTCPILFNQTPEQLRRNGARGGHAHARNRCAGQPATQAAPLSVARQPVLSMETTAQAIVTLDEQFPWLRKAENRASHRQTPVEIQDPSARALAWPDQPPDV